MAKTPKKKAIPAKTVKTAPKKPPASPVLSKGKAAGKTRPIPAGAVLLPKPPAGKAKPSPAVIPTKPTRKLVRPAPEKPLFNAPPAIIPAPIATDGKPRKNQAGLSSKELEFYRSLLLAKRRELVGDMSSMEREALRSTTGTNLSNLPLHMADMGTDNYEQEFTLGLVEKDRQLLREINRALAKIQDGTYGICEGTGKPIAKPRLEAQPWAKFSIEHARQLERNGGFLRR